MKSPQERGFTIPVKRNIGPGRYQKGWAKSMTPINGRIKICFDSGRLSSWSQEICIHEPRGFNPIHLKNQTDESNND